MINRRQERALRAHSVCRRLWLLSLVLLVASRTVCADDPPQQEQVEAQQASEMATRTFAEMTCRLSDGRALVPVKKSLLRWSNPDVGRVYGDVYLWTLDGCPQALVSPFQWFTPYRIKQAEFRSLSRESLVVEVRGQLVWAPNEPGLEWKRFESAPVPAMAATQRLVQMRMLARRFNAVLQDPRKGSEGVTRRQRLLTQPVYRYDSPPAPVLDGALFGFVLGTDPELFLLVEARGEKDESAWYYGLARMNSGPMQVELDGHVIWQVPQLDALSDNRRAYHLTSISDKP